MPASVAKLSRRCNGSIARIKRRGDNGSPCRRPMLLIKLDISKAFDSVRWDYILSLLQHMGFPARWRNWLAAIFSTASSQVLLNGIPGPHSQHISTYVRMDQC